MINLLKSVKKGKLQVTNEEYLDNLEKIVGGPNNYTKTALRNIEADSQEIKDRQELFKYAYFNEDKLRKSINLFGDGHHNYAQINDYGGLRIAILNGTENFYNTVKRTRNNLNENNHLTKIKESVEELDSILEKEEFEKNKLGEIADYISKYYSVKGKSSFERIHEYFGYSLKNINDGKVLVELTNKKPSKKIRKYILLDIGDFIGNEIKKLMPLVKDSYWEDIRNIEFDFEYNLNPNSETALEFIPKINLKKSFLGRKFKTKKKYKDLEKKLSEIKITPGICSSDPNFNEHYKKVFEKYKKDIDELNSYRKSFEELQSQFSNLIPIVKKFKEFGEKGYSLHFPKVSEEKFEIENLTSLRLANKYLGNGQIVTSQPSLNHKNKIRLITGPNAGGKSTQQQSMMDAYLCFQAGFPILASSAKIAPYDGLFEHSIKNGNAELAKSTFELNVERNKETLEAAKNCENPWFVIDELGTGSDMDAIKDISDLVFKGLKNVNASCDVVTQFQEVSENAIEKYGAVPFKVQNYQLIEGLGNAEGMKLAKTKGFDEDFVNRLNGHKE